MEITYMQRSSSLGRPVTIHTIKAFTEKNKKIDSKQVVQLTAEPNRTGPFIASNQKLLRERSITVVIPKICNQSNEESQEIRAEDFENIISNENKILRFVDRYKDGKFDSPYNLGSFLEKELIDLNDEHFFNEFSTKYLKNISLDFTKILVMFDLNLNTENYINLINNKLFLMKGAVELENDRLINSMSIWDKLSAPVGYDSEDKYGMGDTISFFASQIPTDEIKHNATAWKSEIYKDKFVEAFDKGRQYRSEQIQKIKIELKKYFPPALSEIILEYAPELDGKDTKHLPQTPDSSSRCGIQ
jgi:hypothetical protein